MRLSAPFSQAYRALLCCAVAVLAGAALVNAPTSAQTPSHLSGQPQRYAIEVRLNWDAETYGERLPANPHWSRLVAVAHTARYRLFRDGDTASTGLALLATNGRVSVLQAELTEARRRGRAGAHLVVPGIATGAGVFSFELELTERQSQVSFATMLAPSPDWFTGASGIEMRADDGWRAQATRSLWVWDAGADHGADFVADNAETQPRQSVRLLAHPAFLTPRGLAPIGTITLRRIDAI